MQILYVIVVCYLGDRYTYIPWYSIVMYCLHGAAYTGWALY